MTLEELEKLEAAATAGEWNVFIFNGKHYIQMASDSDPYDPSDEGFRDYDAALIVAARNNLSKLIAVASAAKELLEDMRVSPHSNFKLALAIKELEK